MDKQIGKQTEIKPITETIRGIKRKVIDILQIYRYIGRQIDGQTDNVTDIKPVTTTITNPNSYT